MQIPLKQLLLFHQEEENYEQCSVSNLKEVHIR